MKVYKVIIFLALCYVFASCGDRKAMRDGCLEADAVHGDNRTCCNLASYRVGQAVCDSIYRLQQYENDSSLYRKGIDCAFYLLSAAEDISDEELAVHSLSALSRLYIEVGRYDSAYIYVVQALELSKKKHSVTHFVDIYNNLGKINFFCEYYDKAAEYWDMAISFPETYGTPYSKVLVINNSLSLIGDTVEINRRLEQATEICKDNDMPAMLSFLYVNAALLYVNFEDLETARFWMEEALLWPQSRETECNYWKNKGIIEFEAGNYELALKWLNKALDFAAENRMETSEILRVLSYVYAFMGLWEEAYSTQYEYESDSDLLPKGQVLRNFLDIQKNTSLAIEKQHNMYLTAVMVAVLISLVSAFSIFYLSRLRHLKEKEAKITLDNEVERQNIKRRNNILSMKRLQQYQEETLINDIIGKLRNVNISGEGSKSIKDLISELEFTKNNRMWEEIEPFLIETDSTFYNNLLRDFPDLTVNERRLCVFLHMNMTTKEISMVTHKSVNSITTARSRLREKLNIKGNDVSIVSFLDKYSS